MHKFCFQPPINYSASLRALPQLGGAVGASGCVPPRGINLEACWILGGLDDGWNMVLYQSLEVVLHIWGMLIPRLQIV